MESDVDRLLRLMCLGECHGNEWGSIMIDRDHSNRSKYRVFFWANGMWNTARDIHEALRLADDLPDNE